MWSHAAEVSAFTSRQYLREDKITMTCRRQSNLVQFSISSHLVKFRSEFSICTLGVPDVQTVVSISRYRLSTGHVLMNGFISPPDYMPRDGKANGFPLRIVWVDFNEEVADGMINKRG